jgi:hypothetical protein
MRVLSKLTYANVIATLALFLALGGGAVIAAEQLGKNVVKSKNIAPKAVKTQDIAKNAVKAAKIAANAVTGAKVKKEALARGKLKAGTLAGLQVADAQAIGVPGLTTVPPPESEGTPIPLTGTATFIPNAGKSYVLLAELRGTPIDADGANEGGYGGSGCFAFVRIYVNGEPVSGVEISANANSKPPFDVNPIGTASTAVALQVPGIPQTIAANSFGDTGCGAGTGANLRMSVIELG